MKVAKWVETDRRQHRLGYRRPHSRQRIPSWRKVAHDMARRTRRGPLSDASRTILRPHTVPAWPQKSIGPHWGSTLVDGWKARTVGTSVSLVTGVPYTSERPRRAGTQYRWTARS